MERFSFIIQADTAAAAKKSVAAKLTEVVTLGMLHKEDTPPVQAAADIFIGLLPPVTKLNDKEREVAVTVAGCLIHDEKGVVSAVQCIVEAGLQVKPE